MSAKQANTSQTLNYALVIAVLLLVVLVVYGHNFRKRMDELNAPEAPPSVATTPITGDNTATALTAGPTLEDAIHPPSEEPPISIADFPEETPPGVTGALDDPIEVKRVIENQSRQLRAEAAAQGFRPEDKRALALSEEDIRQLERDGNIIY
jgi:hypothetical protein